MKNLILYIFALIFFKQVEAQCTSWTNVANLGSPGGNYQATKTLAECQTQCLNYNNCQYGFDYIDATKQCWISTSSTTAYTNGVQHWSCSSNSPGSCNDFKEYPDRSVNGGTKFNNANNVDACKAACVAQLTCASLDFNFNSNECWLLTVTGPQTTNVGVRHYDLNRGSCSSVTPSSSCNDFKEYIDRSVSGGIKYNSANSVDTCKVACISQTTCIALDFNTATNECWLLTTTGPQITNVGIRHYDLNRGSCSTLTTPSNCNNFREYLDRSVSGGTKSPNVNTLDGCKAACLAQTTCVSLDFNFNNNECWLLTIYGPQITNVGIRHYDLNRSCSSVPSTGACNDFKEYIDRSVSGGIKNNNANNVDQCKAVCIAQSTCVSLDFNTINNECWLLTVTGPQNTNVGVRHYDLNRGSCVSGQTNTINTPTATPTTCQPTFLITYNKHFTGGIQNTAETTLTGCQAACIRQVNCIAFDFNTLSNPNQCWILTQTTPLTDSQGVNHYDINRNPQNCNPKSIYPLYTLTKDFRMSGGGRTSSTALEACKVECVNTATCVGFDFNRINNPNECWLLGTITSLISSPGVDHYDLTRAQMLSANENCKVYKNITTLKSEYVTADIDNLNECKSFCSKTPSCTFGVTWIPLAPRGQQCAYAMKYYLYSKDGFIYYEFTEDRVVEAENVTSEFLGREVQVSNAADCKRECNYRVTRLVWSVQQGKCYTVEPNSIIAKDGHLFYECEK